MLRYLSLIVASALLAGHALADNPPQTFQYTVRIPATEKSCADEATAMAMKIIKNTPAIQTGSGRCLATSQFANNGKTYTVYSVVVSYTATSSLVLNRAQLQINDTGPEFNVLYTTYESCLTDIPSQKLAYTAATKLEVLTAHCEPLGDDYMGYGLFVEGLGSTQAYLHQFKNHVTGAPSQWLSIAKSYLEKSGAVVAKQSGDFFFYYSTLPVAVISESIVDNKTLEECTAQKNEAVSMYTKVGAKNTFVDCHTTEAKMFSLDVIADVSVGIVSDYGAYSGSYYSFAECLANKELVATQYGPALLGAFCAPDVMNDGIYKLNLFTRY